jgi:hypothetical protein
LIGQSVDKIWDVISNYGNIYRYHPEVAKSELTSEITHGVGAVRKCVFNNGDSSIEKVIEWEDCSKLAVELSDISMPLKSASGFTYLKSVDDNSTEITIGMNYIFKYGLFGELIGRFVMKPMMRKMFGKAAKSIEYYIVNGNKMA